MEAAPCRFRTLKRRFGPRESRERDSRFLAYLMPVISLREARSLIEALREEHRDARHICWAVRWHDPPQTEREPRCQACSSDDGEPAGTAGVPILREMEGRKCANLITAVVRYFGGTKLGKGGLARAYGGAAAAALDSAPLEWREITLRAGLRVPFDRLGAVMRLIRRHRVTLHRQRYRDHGVVMSLEVPFSRLEGFRVELRQAGRGALDLVLGDGDHMGDQE